MSNRYGKASFGAKIGFHIMYGVCYLVGLLPFWFLYYVLAEVLYFFVYKIGRYRVKVVRRNLSHSFPEKSAKELLTIERGFYRNLSEYFIDAIDLASMSEKNLLRRMVSFGRDEVNRELDGRNWIIMLGHFGSWEIANAYALYPEMSVLISAYRPLKSKVMDMYYHKIRHRFRKLRSVPMQELLRVYMSNKDGIDGHSVNLALIADQNAPIDANSKWIPFLNQPTVFFRGGEKIARKFGIPVYYMHMRKIRRGHYEQWFEQIWDGRSATADHEITDRFAALLEEDIRQCPEMWMWSHRRWKMRPRGEEARKYNERWGTNIPE